MNKKKLAILIFFAILVVGLLTREQRKSNMAVTDLSIATDKTEYDKEGILRLKIKNGSREDVCFSSCYPYLLERKEGTWLGYEYAECTNLNSRDGCVKTKQEKAFELTLPKVPSGVHRLAIPACVSCHDKDIFEEKNRFYSNEFVIK